ncbi:MAG: MATE family efflux transporter [Firmicutes bacterium]|nr:MATE family efflux transporter [Bacillota bacterium]
MIKDLFVDKDFYKTFFKLAIPVTIQYFVTASLNLVDNIMVGQLGAVELAAVGLANQVYFLLLLFLLGVGGGASVFTAQFWGKRDLKNIRRILGLSLMISSTAALFFFLISILNSETILRLFSHDQQVIQLGAEYLRITSFTYVLTAITGCYCAVLRSTGEVKLPMRVNVIAILSNTFLNYILIFGNFGMPQLGVAGAAIATLISRFIETTILLIASYRHQYIMTSKVSEMFKVPADLTKRFIKTTSVVVIKDFIWAFGMVLYMVVYAKMGTDVVASINIVTTVRQLMTVLFNGIASACLVMVGNQIGAGDYPTAFRYSKRFLLITTMVSIVMAVLTIAGSSFILSPYNISTTVFKQAQAILCIFALYMPITVINMVAIVGVFRSGGDVTFCLIMDLVAVYFIGLPLGFLGQAVWYLPIQGVFALFTSQEIFKFILCIKRFISKHWINNLVLDINPAVANEG